MNNEHRRHQLRFGLRRLISDAERSDKQDQARLAVLTPEEREEYQSLRLALWTDHGFDFEANPAMLDRYAEIENKIKPLPTE